MALFEFEDGQLIPAQFGRTVADGITSEILDAVRSQVLEIVSRPLFPITWRDLSRVAHTSDEYGEEPRLTALDASGQVVSVEVVQHLDSETLIAALSRLARTATLSWSDLAREYPGNVDAFRADWAHFRDSMPPSEVASPRLVIVSASIDTQVRPALDVLAASGIEVHEMTLKQMSNGRAFIEVQTVGPRLFGHVPQVLLGSSAELAQIAPAKQSASQLAEQHVLPEASSQGTQMLASEQNVQDAAHQVLQPEQQGRPEVAWPVAQIQPEQQLTEHPPVETGPAGWADQRELSEFEEHLPSRMQRHQSWRFPPVRRVEQTQAMGVPGHGHAWGQESTGQSYQESTPAQVDSVELANRAAEAAVASRLDQKPIQREAAAALQVPLLEHDVHGLRALGQVIGQTAPLAVRRSLDPYLQAHLSTSGRISVRGQEFSDPTDALVACGFTGLDGWSEWHLGDHLGPTLAESVDEVNREMLREYHRTGKSSQSFRRH